ncbi:MAG: ABC transporter permease [Bacteroidales bacterium]
MNRTLVIAKREYVAAVRTRGFLITILLLPIFMGGSFIVMALTRDKVDLTDKRIAVVDQSGLVGQHLVESAEWRNNGILDTITGEKRAPAYFIELIDYDKADPSGQKLLLSDRVRGKEIYAFLHIGPEVLHPVPGDEASRVFYFSEQSLMDETRNWIGYILNEKIRQIRVAELGLDSKQVSDLFNYLNLEKMGLSRVDSRTGDIREARKSNELEAIIVPYILMFLMFMTIMMSAVPLLTAVMEEKSERIAEVLLGSVSPTQFMMGKVMGGLGVSLTTTIIYLLGGILMVNQFDLGEIIPYSVLPWFFVYMFLNIIMVGSIFAGLGSMCNDSKDAQAIQFPAMLPLILPMFLLMPVIQNPLGGLATWASLFPPFTPMLMLVRQAMQVTIPIWQPIAGLAGVVLFTIFSVWVGGRLFRSNIILHGRRPKLGVLVRQVLK